MAVLGTPTLEDGYVGCALVVLFVAVACLPRLSSSIQRGQASQATVVDSKAMGRSKTQRHRRLIERSPSDLDDLGPEHRQRFDDLVQHWTLLSMSPSNTTFEERITASNGQPHRDAHVVLQTSNDGEVEVNLHSEQGEDSMCHDDADGDAQEYEDTADDDQGQGHDQSQDFTSDSTCDTFACETPAIAVQSPRPRRRRLGSVVRDVTAPLKNVAWFSGVTAPWQYMLRMQRGSPRSRLCAEY